MGDSVKVRRVPRKCLPLPIFMPPSPLQFKHYLQRAQVVRSPLGIRKRLQPHRPVSIRFLSSENTLYNELVFSEVKHLFTFQIGGRYKGFSNVSVKLYSRSDISSGLFPVPSIDIRPINVFVINSSEA